ncbi:MAG TPA: Dabb family protein [Pusillimonas sp.]|uniref:Dabb family protein n=1 Tax=unclassified Pusillimonas TaxID=2640016 RepID=UPI002612CA4C|nr:MULTISPECIES: Dabb family protein [unclassified Pusillimonas]HLU19364.1 Dabb family protein [Pusillimonas sp.]
MPQLAHMVLWRLNGRTAEIKEHQAQEIIAAFEGIKEQIPGLLHLDIGRNVNRDSEWDVALYTVFESAEHLKAYETNPAHIAIKKLVGPMRDARSHVDFELPAANNYN